MASSLRLFQNTHMSISTKDALCIELVDGAVKQGVTSSYIVFLYRCLPAMFSVTASSDYGAVS